jgi:hypothetical protein
VPAGVQARPLLATRLKTRPYLWRIELVVLASLAAAPLQAQSLAALQMGGTLTCHSAGQGQGATFTLELPLRPPETAP